MQFKHLIPLHSILESVIIEAFLWVVVNLVSTCIVYKFSFPQVCNVHNAQTHTKHTKTLFSRPALTKTCCPSL